MHLEAASIEGKEVQFSPNICCPIHSNCFPIQSNAANSVHFNRALIQNSYNCSSWLRKPTNDDVTSSLRSNQPSQPARSTSKQQFCIRWTLFRNLEHPTNKEMQKSIPEETNAWTSFFLHHSKTFIFATQQNWREKKQFSTLFFCML